MSKPEWGIKRLCANCSASFYDMKKNPPVCPSCGTAYDPEALLKSRRRMVPVEAPVEKVKKPEVVAPADAEAPELTEEELEEAVEADDVDEDDEDLEDVEIEDDKE